MCDSSRIHSSAPMAPAWYSSQNMRVCVPAPTAREGSPGFR